MWKTGLPDVIFANLVSNSMVSRELKPTVAGWERKEKQKTDCEKSELVSKGSVREEIKSVHCLIEKYLKALNDMKYT